MSHCLNFLKGGYVGPIDTGVFIGLIKGDTWSLDYASYDFAVRTWPMACESQRAWPVKGS